MKMIKEAYERLELDVEPSTEPTQPLDPYELPIGL